ncbi:MAG: aspartyl protease family protein [Verrucomicrobia bacterium]|nr:aspartyl protease family protein [Verrucomicrobiota bacterium]
MVTLPAQSLGHYLIVEARWDRSASFNFLVDTGASVTLVSPAIARRYGTRKAAPVETPRVQVKSADGRFTELPAATLDRLVFGELRFDEVPVLVYDCAPLSAHLGIKIDGVLGFPLFRETLLTLDYPQSRVIVRRADAKVLLPGTPIPVDDSNKTPLVRVQLGDRTLVALIDSGSDASLSLNPVGLEPGFAIAPRAGAMASTLTGDRPQQVARLADTLAIAGYELPRPIVELTDELSALGGGILRHFTVTFDQQHDRVTFFRDQRAPIPTPPRRSAGVSFTRTPAYWRVASVIPGSPADQAHMEPGDLVTRINGEHVAKWDLRRYEELVATARTITCTLLYGSTEAPTTFDTFELVP